MLIENISDRNGRALEYKIINFLSSSESIFKTSLSSQASSDQKRDQPKYNNLPNELKIGYLRCAQIVHDWLSNIFIDKAITIHKITDNEAKKGDVTDIRIIGAKRQVNLSIKHNHSALKHQRPPTTANWCGYPKKSIEDLEFRKKYKRVIDIFLLKSKKDVPKAKYFRDLVINKKSYIKDNLYEPVCVLVAEAINNLCKNKECVESLFRFLVGSIRFYKIIDKPKEVIMLDFTTVSSPEKVQATLRDKSYIYLTFSNGWKISMRLHTASSRLGKSLKFDTQACNFPTVSKVAFSK